MVFYSQTYEDMLIYKLLKERKDCFWVDVGANDPERFSVTKFFYEMGGRGINIEPAKEFYDRLVKERKRDININMAVGRSDNSSICANIRPTGYLFNGDYSYFDNDEKGDKVEVQTTTLTTILNDYLPENQCIHFLKIDIEGFENECIQGMDFNQYRPWVLCIEVSVSDEWEPMILFNNYIRVWRDELNAYYADSIRVKKGDVIPIPRCSDSIKCLYKTYDAHRYDDQKNCIVRQEEFSNHCDLLSRMLKLKSKEVNYLERIKKDGCTRVAVYGMSVIGERIIDECLQQNITVVFGIDRNEAIDRYDWGDGHVEVYELVNAPLELLDGIIIALINDEEIASKLMELIGEGNIKVYRIKELLSSK